MQFWQKQVGTFLACPVCGPFFAAGDGGKGEAGGMQAGRQHQHGRPDWRPGERRHTRHGKFLQTPPHLNSNYLRQGGNVFAGFCLSVCLFVYIPVYTIEQTSSKRRTDIEQTSSRFDGTPPPGSNVGLGLAHTADHVLYRPSNSTCPLS